MACSNFLLLFPFLPIELLFLKKQSEKGRKKLSWSKCLDSQQLIIMHIYFLNMDPICLISQAEKCCRPSSYMLITWSVWSWLFFNLLFPMNPRRSVRNTVKPPLFQSTDLVDPFLSYAWVNLEFKFTMKKIRKGFMHIIHTLNTSTNPFLRCCSFFFLTAWS